MTSNVTTLHVTTVIMPVCMASYMTVSYGHANHAFRVNVMLLRLIYVLRLLYTIRCFRVMACLGF
jgi:hypothetical protein